MQQNGIKESLKERTMKGHKLSDSKNSYRACKIPLARVRIHVGYKMLPVGTQT